MIVLGEGVLGWTSGERQIDRYGAVHLNYGRKDKKDFAEAPVGRLGELFAEILHSSSAPGEVIFLGEGELFTERQYTGLVSLGVKPVDGRAENWLSVEGLYRCDGNVVRLVFTPREETQ